jgi:flagellar biosynthesis chaperone FliJ
MRNPLLASTLLLFLSGCAAESSYVHTDTTLGRVVVYRNGIAYFERTAALPGETLSLSVPADKVDDFLKSLTVVDAKTGEPAPISYPTRQANPETGLIDMKITLPPTAINGVVLTYVTESPSWKPSYRIVLKDKGKVSVQGWAIVDNTSGEDWKNVKLGVGSSSALSFRFDLRSVRLVQRETLQTNDQFAMAPPTGGATYGAGQGPTTAPRLVMEIGDEALAKQEREFSADVLAVKDKEPSRNFQSGTGSAAGSYGGKKGNAVPTKPTTAGKAAPGPQLPPAPPNPLESMAKNLKTSPNQIVVEGYADSRDGDKIQASLERANRAREQLVRAGLDPNKVVAIGNGMQTGKSAGVRIVEAPQAQSQVPASGAKAAAPAEPIGTSHFESTTSMTVARGTSAMVSILKTDTDGEVVYFYDAESARGNKSFPFNAVRIKNPTDSVLETGPVTVFGDGKFIGEGLTEPIPAKSIAFIPFALDRQVLVETEEDAVDKIAKIITVQRGVFSTEVQHTRRSKLTLNNRTAETAVVYIRHTVPEGYTLTKPENAKEKLGAAYLLKVEIAPRSKKEITIEEATPLFKSTDIRGNVGMEMVVAYLSQSATEGPLKEKVDGLLKIQREIGNIEQKITTMREQMEEYRARMDELHVQLVSLKAVKTAGPLMQSLEKKLSEVSDKLSKATIDLVGEQEKLMVAKIKFQDGVAELSMDKKKEEPKPEEKPVPKKV